MTIQILLYVRDLTGATHAFDFEEPEMVTGEDVYRAVERAFDLYLGRINCDLMFGGRALLT